MKKIPWVSPLIALCCGLLTTSCSDTDPTPIDAALPPIADKGPLPGNDKGPLPAKDKGTLPSQDQGTPTTGVGYFVAVHCDPTATLEFDNVSTMIAAADKIGVKLTLMFSPQWADVIVGNGPHEAAISAWKTAGHEIAAHHHSPYHGGTWDGYTDLTEAAWKALKPTGTQVGTMNDWWTKVKTIDPGIQAGCLNEEKDKTDLHTNIKYSSCPGYYNFGAVPTRVVDGGEAQTGRNDFALKGKTVDGVQHYWLGHAIIGGKFFADAKAEMQKMTQGVFGVIVHTKTADVTQLGKWLSFLSEQDPGASRSYTLSEIFAGGLLPEMEISTEELSKVYN